MAITTTTLAADVALNDQIWYLASSAGAQDGTFLQKGSEYARVSAVLAAGAVRVQRGVNGTCATVGTSGDSVSLGSVNDFVNAAPVSGIADGAAQVIIPANPPQPVTFGGDVAGPGSATAGNLPAFADTTGKVLDDSGIAAPDQGVSTTDDVAFAHVTAAYKAADGTAGVSAGPFTVITAITVKNGLITAITGS